MISSSKMAALLNRSLTSSETSNYKTYLKIAQERLSGLLCMNLSTEVGERTYETRDGYRTVYVDPFTELTSITDSDGETIDSSTYTVMQWDSYNAPWYNSIVFDELLSCQRIVVEAEWGFDCLPVDLESLLAKLFALGSIEQNMTGKVKSKRIEDFWVTYEDVPTIDGLVSNNLGTIKKYSLCNLGYVKHGKSLYPVPDDNLYISQA